MTGIADDLAISLCGAIDAERAPIQIAGSECQGR